MGCMYDIHACLLLFVVHHYSLLLYNISTIYIITHSVLRLSLYVQHDREQKARSKTRTIDDMCFEHTHSALIRQSQHIVQCAYAVLFTRLLVLQPSSRVQAIMNWFHFIKLWGHSAPCSRSQTAACSFMYSPAWSNKLVNSSTVKPAPVAMRYLYVVVYTSQGVQCGGSTRFRAALQQQLRITSIWYRVDS
jgi:hypothetical protein